MRGIVKCLTINEGTDVGEVTASRVLMPVLGRIPGHVFWRAAARISTTAGEVLPAEVDLTAYAALHALDAGVARSQQDVADAVAVSRTTMVKVAADLAAAGLVDRERNVADRRSYLLARTDAGDAALPGWDAEVDRLEAVVTSPYDGAEREGLLAGLHRLGEEALPPDLPAAVRSRVALVVPRLHAWLYREFAVALTPLALEPRHLGALVALGELGPVAQSELARAVGVSAASAVVLVDELEARGLVERRRAPQDRRTQVLHLAETAPATTREARELGRTTAGRIFARLDADERERLLTLLRRMVTSA